MSIELFVFPPSPRAFVVMAVANHLGLDHTLRMVDLRKGEQKAPDYAALNPNMRMPTLREDGYVLWEANAIGQYLALKKPDSGLLPKDERARLDVTRWQFWDLAHWHPACAVFAFEYVAKSLIGAQPDLGAVANGVEPFHRVASVLDGQLAERKFVTGDNLSLADFSIGAAMNLAAMAHYPIERYSHVQRWHAELCKLQAWQKTLQQCALPTAVAA